MGEVGDGVRTGAQVADGDAGGARRGAQEGWTVSVGASTGAATAPRGDGDGASAADALLHEADQAVYCAKAQGKGRVVVFDGAARARAAGAGAELSTPAAPERGVSAAPG